MVRLLKLLAYIIFFVFALMYFTPKVALYYFAESKLEPYGVVITEEDAVDNGFTLSIKDAGVTFKAIESAEVKDTKISIFGVYNNVSINDITLSSTAASFVPTDIKNIDITYSIFNPLNIVANANGGFGDAEAKISLVERNIFLKLKPSNMMSQKYASTLRGLKKSKDGGYEYAKTF
jgi:hypothetical protein